MTKQEVFAAIKNLVAPTNKVEVKFERIALEGGEVFITNQTEDTITVGDAIYIETESGFELAPMGLHTLEDGREINLDENSVVVEIREVEDEVVTEDVVVDKPLDEVVVTASEESAKIGELKTAIHDLLMAFESHSNDIDKRFKSLEADYNAFKQDAEYTPIKKDNSFKSTFSKLDSRIEMMKGMRK